jgi:uncharacterized protein YndB with AHSA1/START domain
MSANTLRLEMRIAARRETVFRFLSDRQSFRKWMGDASDLNPSVGGAVRVVYPGGDQAEGEVLELSAPSRVVYSWGYRDAKHGLAPGSTRVTIDLDELPDGSTLLRLTHAGLPTAQHRDNHEQGWRFYTNRLATASADAQFRTRIGALLNAYAASWNETDDSIRARHLEQCWADTGTYRDHFAVVDGRPAMARHIAMSHGFARGARVELDGEPQLCHEYIYFPWRISSQPGPSVAHGRSFATLAMDGRIQSIVAFWDT